MSKENRDPILIGEVFPEFRRIKDLPLRDYLAAHSNMLWLMSRHISSKGYVRSPFFNQNRQHQEVNRNLKQQFLNIVQAKFLEVYSKKSEREKILVNEDITLCNDRGEIEKKLILNFYPSMEVKLISYSDLIPCQNSRGQSAAVQVITDCAGNIKSEIFWNRPPSVTDTRLDLEKNKICRYSYEEKSFQVFHPFVETPPPPEYSSRI